MLKDQAATSAAGDRHAGSGDGASGKGGGGVQEEEAATGGSAGGDSSVGDGLVWGSRGDGEGLMKQTGTVLDALSEAYARRRSWEQARCASTGG